MRELKNPPTNPLFPNFLMLESPFPLRVPFTALAISSFSNHKLPIYSIRLSFATLFRHDLGPGSFGGLPVPDQQGRNETNRNE